MTQERLSELESQIVSDQSMNPQVRRQQVLVQEQSPVQEQNPVQERHIVQDQSPTQEIIPQVEANHAVESNSAPTKPQNLPEDFQIQIQTALENIFNTSPEIKAAIEEISNSPNANEVQQKYNDVLERLVQVVVARIFANPNTINDSFSYRIPVVLNDPTKRIKTAVVYIQKEVDTSSDRPEVSTAETIESTQANEQESREEPTRVVRSIPTGFKSQDLDVVEVKDFIANQILDPLVKHCKDLRETKANNCFKNNQEVR